jgi:hypothetical protein
VKDEDDSVTPKLTPEMFTAREGFEPGVVIEIAFNRNVAYFDPDKLYIFRFNRVSIYGIVVVTENNGTELQPYTTEIKSLSILTGSHRHWSWAPNDAVGLVEDPDDMVPLRFYDLAAEFKYDRLRLLGSEHKYVFTARPWWSTFGKDKPE